MCRSVNFCSRQTRLVFNAISTSSLQFFLCNQLFYLIFVFTKKKRAIFLTLRFVQFDPVTSMFISLYFFFFAFILVPFLYSYFYWMTVDVTAFALRDTYFYAWKCSKHVVREQNLLKSDWSFNYFFFTLLLYMTCPSMHTVKRGIFFFE